MVYTRPVLCRLCECPVADAGVRVVLLELDKLARWWKQELGTELDDDAETLCRSWICQFCVCDARFTSEFVRGDIGCDWWTGHLDRFYEKFVSRDWLILPCEVKIRLLLLPVSASELQKSCGRKKKSPRTLKPTDCVYCGIVFRSIRAAYLHGQADHKDIRKFSCINCSLWFKTSAERKVHWDDLHKQYRCHFCAARVFNRNNLWDHISEQHSNNLGKLENVIECCSQVLASKTELSNHMDHGRTPETCLLCGKEVNSMRFHCNYRHKSQIVRCHYRCKALFVSLEEKEKHVKEVHESEPDLVQCVYCPCKFKKTRICIHISHMHRNRSIRCTYPCCLSFFVTEEERNEHILKIHLGPRVVKSLDCVYCGKELISKSTLRQHVDQKHKSSKVICKIRGCSMFFKSDAELSSHFELEHAAEERKRVFECAHCGYKFVKLSTLKNHIVLIHGARNIKCKKCSKIFNSSITYKTHYKRSHVHRDTWLHCQNSFKYLSNHLLVVPCKFCKKVMHCKTKLVEHKLKCPLKP